MIIIDNAKILTICPYGNENNTVRAVELLKASGAENHSHSTHHALLGLKKVGKKYYLSLMFVSL